MSFSSITGSSSGSSPATSSAAWHLGAARRDRKLWCALRDRVDHDILAQELTSVEVEEILRQLHGITLPNSRIRNEEVAGMIAGLVQVIPRSSELLCSELTRFVHKCSNKEKLVFTTEQLQRVLGFYLRFLTSCPSWYTASAIRAVGAILRDNVDRVTDEMDDLIALLMQYLDPAGVDMDARYAATSCVSSICTQAARAPDMAKYFAPLLRMIVENFRQQAMGLTKGQQDRVLVRACTCSMKCIYTIMSFKQDQLVERIEANLASLLSSMRQVMGFGLVLRSEAEQLVFEFQDDAPPTDSDSSLCGSDSMTSSRPGNEGLLARLRITVLTTLECVAEHFPKALTSCVGLYLPEQTSPYMTLYYNAPSVLTLLIADPSERVRMAAGRFLEAFWEKIPLRQYFRHVTSVVAPSTSFASMPKKMSYMMYQVHVTLVYCIQNERNTLPLSQMLKTTASIIQQCPYANVVPLLDKSGINPPLSDVLKALASSLYSSTFSHDHSVRMASLSCFSALFNLQEPLSSIQEWMIQTNSPKSFIEVAHISISCSSTPLAKRSFVEELLFIAARPEEASKSLLRLESMSLLSKIAKNYSHALSAYWTQLSGFMLVAFQDVDPNVRLQAIKIMENYIKGESSLPRNIASSRNDDMFGSPAIPSSSPRTPNRWLHSNQDASAVSREDCLSFLAKHLVRAFADPSHHVRTSVCACFTLLRPKDWEQLLMLGFTPPTAKAGSGHQKNSNTVTTLRSYSRVFLQTPRDCSPVVRAAGFRLLGSLCLVPLFKTRDFASSVVALALDALSDSTLNVRVRAAWALGNVCTTTGPESFPALGGEDMSVTVLYDYLSVAQMRLVLEKMIVGINDNDKVASSVARTLGLVCRWIYFKSFASNIEPKDRRALEDLVDQTMTVLSGKVNCGSPKVRWNACHAIAKILLCPELPLASVPWAPVVFQALIVAVTQQENFKVRISAASALRVSSCRSSYGSFFDVIVRAIIDALESASDLKDVTEFKYKEQLETQLSFTLVHLIHLAADGDDDIIADALRAKPAGFLYDWVFHNLHRMYNAIDQHDAASSGPVQDDSADAPGSGSATGGGAEMHDANPIKKDEILTAVRTLLRILERERPGRQRSPSLSILYDAKLSLERDVLYSHDDLTFEF